MLDVKDPTSKIAAIRAAQKFFSEDKDRGFEAKVALPILCI
jgi:vacuolar protein sorting-associated protein 16